MKAQDLYLKSAGIPDEFSGRKYEKIANIKDKFEIDDKIIIKETTVFDDEGNRKTSEKGTIWKKRVVFLPIKVKDEKIVVATTSDPIYQIVRHLEYDEKVINEDKSFLIAKENIEGEFSFTKTSKSYGDKQYDVDQLKFESL